MGVYIIYIPHSEPETPELLHALIIIYCKWLDLSIQTTSLSRPHAGPQRKSLYIIMYFVE